MTAFDVRSQHDPAVELDEVGRLLIAGAQRYLAQQHRDYCGYLNPRDPKARDLAKWREMGKLGWLAIRIPESMGGPGLELGHTGFLAEEFGAALLPEPFIASAVLLGALCAELPDDQLSQQVSSELIEGSARTALAWQEHKGQVDAASPATTCSSSGSVTGKKLYVPHADVERFIVLAAEETNLRLVVVPANATGVVATPHRLGDGALGADVVFHQAQGQFLQLASTDVLGSVQNALDQATLASAAFLAGIARGALEATLRHLRERIQFERPLGAFQVLRHRATDIYMAQQLAHASWLFAAKAWDEAPASASSRAAISAAKARASAAALMATKTAIQIHGGLGFAEEAGWGFALRVAHQYAVWLGSRRQHLARFAKLAGLQDD